MMKRIFIALCMFIALPAAIAFGDTIPVTAKNTERTTPLIEAVKLKDMDAIEKLAVNSNVNLRDEEGKTALHYAAEHGNETTVRLLLKNGANIRLRDSKHRTPIWYAAKHRRLHTSQTLIGAGANPREDDINGRNALYWIFARPINPNKRHDRRLFNLYNHFRTG